MLQLRHLSQLWRRAGKVTAGSCDIGLMLEDQGTNSLETGRMFYLQRKRRFLGILEMPTDDGLRSVPINKQRG
jgi:hypothetical protein